MPTLIDKTECIEDIWQPLSADALKALITEGQPIPEASILAWSDWLTLLKQSRETLPLRLAVAVPNTVEPEDILSQGFAFSLIALEFPLFTDGRAYSQARMLREQGYQGELRATGDVLADQLFYMARCGFDSFALKDGKDPADALSKFKSFSVTYQAGADIAEPLYQR